MSLINILSRFAPDVGLSMANADQRALATRFINDAVTELNNSYDLINSRREQLFTMGITDQQITLPWYVDGVRRIRDYDSMFQISNYDMSPRYETDGWNVSVGYDWRTKQENFATERDILNVGPLTISFAQPVDANVNVKLVLETVNSKSIVETVTFLVGDQTKSTTKLPTNVFSIEKSNETTYDLTVSDVDGNVISQIPNHRRAAKYTLIQVLDRFQQLGQTKLAEVLYKLAVSPMKDDYDTLPWGDLYDDAIYWKAIAGFYEKSDSEVALQKALGAEAKCMDLIVNIAKNRNTGKRMKMDFGPNRFRQMTERAPISAVNNGVRGLMIRNY